MLPKCWCYGKLCCALIQGLLLVLLAWLVPGIQVHSFAAAVLGGLIITLVLGLAWRLIYWSAARLHPILFPLLTFFLTGIVIILAVNLVDLLYPGALEISGLWDAILVALAVTLGMTFLGALFSLQDDRGYDWFVTQPLSRRYNQTLHAAQAGILFLEIDGLAEPVLRSALDQGWMPTLKRWVETGTHQVKGWEPDLSSQTSASQAGILLGNNDEIPALAHLKRSDGFSNAPDILVMSLYRPETGEVAAFEELVGYHGGLGGPQTQPFVL